MRRGLLLALAALVFLAVPAHAQVSEADLTPFVGRYTVSGTGERQHAYISSNSGMILTWYYGTGCHIDPTPPCDYRNPSGPGSSPGGKATAAFWTRDGDSLIGTVLSTNQPDWIAVGPISVMLLSDGKLGVRQNDIIRVFDRVP